RDAQQPPAAVIGGDEAVLLIRFQTEGEGMPDLAVAAPGWVGQPEPNFDGAGRGAAADVAVALVVNEEKVALAVEGGTFGEADTAHKQMRFHFRRQEM